jgi:hypothetical protein
MKIQNTPILLALTTLLSTASMGISGQALESPTAPSEAAPRYSFLDPVGDFARDSILRPTQPFEMIPGKNPDDWSFMLEPYVWSMSLSGNVGLKGAPPVGVSYDSITVLRHLQWFIFMRGEVRKGRWGVLADGYYASLEGRAEIKDRIYDSGSLGLQQSIVSAALSYRVIDDRRGFLDLYAGARYNYLGMQISTSLNESRIDAIGESASNAIAARLRERASNASASELQQALNRDPDIARLTQAGILKGALTGGAVDPALRAYVKAELAARANEARQDLREAADKAKEKLSKEISKRIKDRAGTYATGNEWWVDPIIGLRGQINLRRWLFLAAEGDVGGFGAGSDIAWNAQATVGVNFTRHIFGQVGYRYMYVDYANGGIIYSMNQYGIFSSVGVGF